MQMIWSGALIEHGWSAPGPVGSEVTVCHRERLGWTGLVPSTPGGH